MNGNLRKTVFAAFLSAAALIAFMIENLFPPLFIPGARLGVSNVFVLFAVVYLGIKEGFAVLTVKIILGSVFTGNVSAMLYSLPSGLFSLSVQVILLVYAKNVSITAVSTVGGTVNLILQNSVFCLIAGKEYFIYLPYLSAIGALSGAFVGITVYFLVKGIPRNLFNKKTKVKENEN